MSLRRKPLALALPVALVVGAASLAVLPSASAADPTLCSDEFVSLVVSNGKKQYFCFVDGTGEVRQTFSSKNPWEIDPAAPKIMQQPGAEPDGAHGQVYTGSSQGIGVISSLDDTGEERDSISAGDLANEALILVRDPSFGKDFTSLELGLTVLQDGTEVVVQPVDIDGRVLTDDGGALEDTFTGNTGASLSEPFGESQQWIAAGFKISARSGEFTIDGNQPTRFIVDSSVPPVTLSDAQVEAESVTLNWTNPDVADLESVTVTRGGTTICSGLITTCEETGLTSETEYTWTITTRDTSGNTSTVTTTETTLDNTPPGPVTLGEPTVSATSVTLNWTNPDVADLESVTVTRGGTTICSGLITTCEETGLTSETEYTWTITTRDTSGNTSTVTTTETTLDNTPPGPVTLGEPTVSATSVTLNWTNPDAADLDAIVVTRDGTEITCEGVTAEPSATQTCTDTGLEPNTTYTYTVTTKDKSGNESSVSPDGGVTTLDGLSDASPVSEIVSDGGSSIRAELNECDFVVPENDPIPFTLDISENRSGSASSPTDVVFNFIEFDERDIAGCRFTLEIFMETTENLSFDFDPDGPRDDPEATTGPGSIFPDEGVEQVRCVDGVSPTPGSTLENGDPNYDVSCIERMTLGNGIVVFDDGDPDTPEVTRDGQQFFLTGYFDARGRFFS